MPDPSVIHEETVPLEKIGETARRGRLWAVLDACDCTEVQGKVEELGAARAVSLYRGPAEANYWAIAPYLVRVDEDLLGWIRETLRAEPWGFLAEATSDLESLRTHFRRFLTVEDANGRKMYFRFYDPRVLTTFLRASDEPELREFFGPIERVLVGPDAEDQPRLRGFGPVRTRGTGAGTGTS